MGLDMYLTKETYVSHAYMGPTCPHTVRDECQRAYVSRDSLKELLDTSKAIVDTAVLVETGETYSLHTPSGIVQEPVRRIENTAAIEELMPTTNGFFFGSTEYDEWYLQDITATVKIIEGLFAEDAAEMERTGKTYPSGEFYYQSSW